MKRPREIRVVFVCGIQARKGYGLHVSKKSLPLTAMLENSFYHLNVPLPGDNSGLVRRNSVRD